MRYLSEVSLKRIVGGLPTTNSRIDLDKFLACLKDVDDIKIGRCKDCAHNPVKAVENPKSWSDIQWNETKCPYYCVNHIYSRIPAADGFCHLWEPKKKEDDDG